MNWKHAAVIALIAFVVVIVTFRSPLRKLATGATAAPTK